MTKEEHDYLSKKALSLRQRMGIPSVDLIQIYRYYNQSHRHYHNLSHIYNLFKLNDQLSTDYHQLTEIAIWFHDVIYQPFYKNNEARSYDFFIKKIKKSTSNGLSEEEMKWIEAAIMSTSGHAPRIPNEGVKLFLDMDLSILTTDWSIYNEYTKGIRKEYWIYPNSMYRKGRRKVLEHFLSREDIFYTPVFQAKEAIARANLNREIAFLSA